MTRLAIVGSGATGFVAERMLSNASPGIRLHVFHGGTEPPSHRLGGVDQTAWSRDDLALLHEEIRRQVGFKFPPPKSDFGQTVPAHAVRGKHTVWRSREPGGLTRYWSASLLPFTAGELSDCGFDAHDFDDHYRWVADEVGLAARDDGLDRYFGRSFASRPPITPTRLAAALIDAVERKASARADGVVAGLNRAAIETRPAHPRQCVLCGGCFYGCQRQSVFNSANDPATRSSSSVHVYDRVLRVRAVTGGYELETASDRHGPFERVFCAAGCAGTAELVSRSFGSRQTIEFVDNELYVFPLVYLGRRLPPQRDYLAIANALIGLLPDDRTARYAEAHVAPIPDLLTRFYLPARLDRTAAALARGLRGRFLLVKLYLHSDTAARLALTATDSDLEIGITRDGTGDRVLPAVLARLRQALAGTGFWLPRGFAPLRSRTSSHYAGGLDPSSGTAADARTGEVAPRFHALDSSLLPFSPAQPLTFTTMANARRIVRTALGV
jgi:hypothetical protein